VTTTDQQLEKEKVLKEEAKTWKGVVAAVVQKLIRGENK
jgi:hypothetical protein